MSSVTNRVSVLGDKLHDKGWGFENWLHNSDDLCVKILQFNPGARFSLHFHRDKEEVFYVLHGELILESRDIETGETLETVIRKGQAILIPRLVAHRLTVIGTGPARILEASTHHEDSDSYRVEPGDSQKK